MIKEVAWRGKGVGGGGPRAGWVPVDRGAGRRVRKKLASRGKARWVPTRLGGRGVQGGGARARGGGCKGLVGGRDTGPRDGANFATCVVFLPFLSVQNKKNGFF